MGQVVYSNTDGMQSDGPPPILRAVALTAQSSETRYSPTGVRETTPQVRRMRLKSDDVCAVIGSSSLWDWLTPEEVVTIVGQNMHRMAADAADAVAAEVRKRMGEPSANDAYCELTLIVLYFAGEHYVKDFDVGRANHLDGDPFVSESLLANSDISGAEGCCASSLSRRVIE